MEIILRQFWVMSASFKGTRMDIGDVSVVSATKNIVRAMIACVSDSRKASLPVCRRQDRERK